MFSEKELRTAADSSTLSDPNVSELCRKFVRQLRDENMEAKVAPNSNSNATSTGVSYWGPSLVCNEHLHSTTTAEGDAEDCKPPTEWDLNPSDSPLVEEEPEPNTQKFSIDEFYKQPKRTGGTTTVHNTTPEKVPPSGDAEVPFSVPFRTVSPKNPKE